MEKYSKKDNLNFTSFHTQCPSLLEDTFIFREISINLTVHRATLKAIKFTFKYTREIKNPFPNLFAMIFFRK